MKIIVTGGSGLVGSAIKKISKDFNHDFIFLSSKDCNLLNYDEVYKLLQKEKPSLIIHLAAMVGGLFKNMNYPVEMYENNITMNTNLLKCAHECHVQNIISCLSTCIFPDKTTYPINEEMLEDGAPHESNFAYAYAKRMLEVHSRSYQKQYNRNYMCVIPTNIYGPNDNFSLEDGHVIPALIHKCFLAKKENIPFEVRGTGKPLRQFIYSEDLAKLILLIAEFKDYKETIILSTNEEASIGRIGELIATKFDYIQNIAFNTKYSDGQFKKTADNSKLVNLINDFKFTEIEDGINRTIDWFIKNYEICRK